MTNTAFKNSFAAEFSGVSKSYDGRSPVVEDFNLSIQAGEFLTLLGPSGSGKTTSLMMLAGFEAPTVGDILVNGISVRNLPPHRRNIGVVFQSYALFPHMTVAENLAFPLVARRHNRSQIVEKVSKSLRMIKLQDFDRRRPEQLSGGQQQRVALARAMIFDPHLVLMDEPLGALDKQLREQMQLEIKYIQQKSGVTVVYVTHDQSEALAMSDRIVVMNRGKIEQIASPTALYNEPATAFVAQFIGESNSLFGRVVNSENDRCHIEVLPGIQILGMSAQRKSTI